MAWKDSGGQERAQASGEIVAAERPPGVPCSKRGCRFPGQRPGAFCIDCGQRYHRCADHGGTAGAQRSLHSHRALYHPKTVR